MAEATKKSGWHQQKSGEFRRAISQRPREEVLLDQARDFDKRFPVGTEVWFWRSLPKGPKVATTISKEAFVAASGDVCCFVAGVSGYVGCDFITPREAEVRSPQPAPQPTAAASEGYVVAIFPRGAAVSRDDFEKAAGRPIVLAGGGPEQSLYGIRLHPGESGRGLRDALRKKFPGGKFTVQPELRGASA